MSKQNQLVELARTGASGGGNKNLIINGAMNIAQRSTSAVTVSDGSNEGYSTVDRFKVDFGSAMGGALSAQQVDTPAGNSEFGKSLKLQCTTVNSSAMGSGSNRFLSVAQYLEGLDLQHLAYGQADAKKLTCSFWVYTNKTGRYGFSLIAQDSGGSYDVWGSYFDVATANTWQKVTFTIEGNTSADIIATNTYGFLLDIYLSVGANRAGVSDSQWQAYSTARVSGVYTDYVDFLDSTSNIFYVTGVQLEIGEKATDFEHRTFADELAKCQRYFVIYKPETSAGIAHAGFMNINVRTSTAIYGVVHYPVEMRLRPSIAKSGTITIYFAGTSSAMTSQAINGSTKHSAEVAFNISSGGSAGSGGWCRIQSGAYFSFDAEL